MIPSDWNKKELVKILTIIIDDNKLIIGNWLDFYKYFDPLVFKGLGDRKNYLIIMKALYFTDGLRNLLKDSGFEVVKDDDFKSNN